MCPNLHQMLHSNVSQPKTNVHIVMWSPLYFKGSALTLKIYETIKCYRITNLVIQLMRKRMPRLEWLRYSAFVLLYPLGCAGEIGVIEATIKHMTDPREYHISSRIFLRL